MPLLTPEQYLESVEKLKPKVYVAGKLVTNIMEHPVTKTIINTNAKVYELALDPQYKEIMTATSHLTGEIVNRCNHVLRSAKDVEMRMESALLISQFIGTCNYRCPGADSLSALAAVTYEMDQKLGTKYEERFNKYLKHIQNEDLSVSGALTDAKGDRNLRPTQLEDPDMYVHVSERHDDGIIVRGAKVNQSGAIAAHETIVLPGRGLRQGEEDYAVAFALPNGAEGVTYITQFTPFSAERMYAEETDGLGNPDFGVRETCMLILDDVFIPWDRVFMCGEVGHAGKTIANFAKAHRMNCGGACKVGFADLIIGGTATVADQLGIAKAPHIIKGLAEMVRIRETLYACSTAAALKSREAVPGSGIYLPHDMFSNICKLNCAEGFWDIVKIAGDIAGGLVVTLPAHEELKNPDTKDYVKKYLKAVSPAEDRMRMTRFLQNWVAGLHAVGVWHGAGSPQAQWIAMSRLGDMERKKKLAKDLVGLETETE
jgi:4-hydroxybutyryl-CoA dehydratase/vinylacetyl-CoA-Delta-isomerase